MTVSVDISTQTRTSEFMSYLDEWFEALPEESLQELMVDAGGPDGVAVVVVDMLKGFCSEGPLASPRVDGLSQPIAEFLTAASEAGINRYFVVADAHDDDASEFDVYPPHCVAGSLEAEVVDEIAELPFSDRFSVIRKNNLSPFLSKEGERLDLDGIRTFVVVGDCTDLCVYHTAMPLKLSGYERNIDRRVLVVEELVQTFDTPVEQARKLGVPAHDGDLFHRFFLYHMAFNGVEVVRRLRA